ncbi:hypothetical protein V7S43_012916 [Phytophthora oleae]|uniref:KATNIP domain-containing protein n=1 Tax=Phytophthora oleae TaxID=2107226 RepID=A0ABD3F5I7_9STRA
MAERKRWDKQHDFHPSAPPTTEAKADPVLTKQLQYIKVLEERNRVKKRLAAASKRNDRLQEREEAFVTAFNVPTRATQPATSRNTRSATSVLPTKMPGKQEAKLTKCRSAPSTTLNFSAGGDDRASESRIRAKWNRPQAPMGVAVERQDGLPLFRLATQEEKSEDEEESYLEESFEEFEEEDEKKELVIDDIEEEDTGEAPDLSKTTKELFGMIQHLSRTKQRALVDVLHKFQSSEQDENDMKVLQSSIGDPAIWKEITSALNTTSAAKEEVTRDLPAVAPLKNLLEDQMRWEDEYANEMKERLAKERQEKQRILKEAEERRAKMMKQLEDEEREIERLMEIKRQERLAKLRSLQEDPSERLADAKSTPAVSKPIELTIQEDEKEDETESKLLPEPVPVVPRLNLPSNSTVKASNSSESCEIKVKLLSTWSRTRAVGLTQICVYDLNGEELSVDLESVQLYDQPTGRALSKTNDMVRGLPRLFNGVAETNREKDMWLGRLGDSGILLLKFEVSSTPSKLCVWNYNGKTACTRDVEVLVAGKSVWTGSLPETFGDEDDNTCTWIDLLGTARKTSRTARVDDNSLATDRTDAKATKWVDTPKSDRQLDELTQEKAIGGTPLWLAGAASSTERLLATSRSSAEFETWNADDKQSSISVTSRRRQGKPLYSARGPLIDAKDEFPRQNLPDRADAKVQPSQTTEEKPRYQPVASTLAFLSSWDSLERFSKTNRSRLPLPTDTATTSSGMDGAKYVEDKSNTSSTRTSFTTSALLTELRQGPSSFMSVSLSPEVLKYSSSEPNFAGRPTEVDQHDAIPKIPVLPSGKWLQIEILSTWGDPYYVGLNGVEIFDHCGELVTFQDPINQVTACPESINVLEENSDDPRVPRNLVDGMNFTCDDLHMWLAPYTPGEAHYVLLELDTSVSISMVRIWNYNKSRTHTCRGVRDARLILYSSVPSVLNSGNDHKLEDSGKTIFEGEIRQAPGLVGADSMESSNEVILFTQEAAILAAIEANDQALRVIAREQQREDEETREIVDSVHRSMELRRPQTSDAGSRTTETSSKTQQSDDQSQRTGRPMTMATGVRTSIDSWVEEPQRKSPDALKMIEGVSVKGRAEDLNSDGNLLRGRRLTLQLLSTWGDLNYVGLTQMEVLVGSRGTPTPLDVDNLDASPRDLSSLGYIGDPRTLDKLVDGEVTTCDDTHMWLVPFEAGAVPEVRIELKTAQYFYGLRLWNYNKSPEDTYRGVKQLVVLLDGVVISPKETGFLVRKAPGVADFQFDQLLRFTDDGGGSNKALSYSERVHYPFRAITYKTPIIRQDYEAPLYPQGFLLKIICWTTWGDPYYLGLNGLELYDFSGARIVDRPTILFAVPYSVSELDHLNGQQQDTRTPDNLVSGLDKNTWEAHDSWLAPLASSLGNQQGNIVYIGFDTPVVLSMIKFWNYSKTPERGVKEMDIYLDDCHLFSGTLNKAPIADRNGGFGKVHKVTEQFGQAVLFSSSQAQVAAEKRNVYYCGVEEQDVLGINEGQVMQESRAMYRKPDPGAAGVVVDLDLRPMTAVCRQ